MPLENLFLLTVIPSINPSNLVQRLSEELLQEIHPPHSTMNIFRNLFNDQNFWKKKWSKFWRNAWIFWILGKNDRTKTWRNPCRNLWSNFCRTWSIFWIPGEEFLLLMVRNLWRIIQVKKIKINCGWFFDGFFCKKFQIYRRRCEEKSESWQKTLKEKARDGIFIIVPKAVLDNIFKITPKNLWKNSAEKFWVKFYEGILGKFTKKN